MARDLSIGGIIGAILMVSVLALLGIPILQTTATNQSVNVYKSINQTNNVLLQNQIYQPLNTSLFSSNGYGASILNNLGFAFILPDIFQFMTAMIRLPNVFIFDMATALQATGLPGIAPLATGAMMGTFLMFLLLYISIQGASGWNKYDYWNG